ncbi:MAG TPA: hypothetical protein DDW55_05905 [Gammaproteobacteria bacterium]|nr:hypothetical protein [Gammaproteobacteria bacterium]
MDKHINSTTDNIPLCVDLDGTLVRSDTLIESVVQLARDNFLYLFMFPFWVIQGRAYFKDMIASHVTLDAEKLPYQMEFISYLRSEQGKGRQLILTTAAHHSIADVIADHLGIFDEVFATTAERNNKGSNKRDELVEHYGRQGFDYAGNSAADLDVWEDARLAVIVNPHRGVVSRAEKVIRIDRVFDDRRSIWRR